jgi:hypothetical protein
MPQQQINQYLAVEAQLIADDLQQGQIQNQAREQVRKLERESANARSALNNARSAAIFAGLSVINDDFAGVEVGGPRQVVIDFDPNRTADQVAALELQAKVFATQIRAVEEQNNIVDQGLRNARIAEQQAIDNRGKINEALFFNGMEINKLQGSSQAIGAPASTAGDAEANALANAALIAQAALPQPNAPEPVPIGPSQFDPDLPLFANPGLFTPAPVLPGAVERGDQTPPGPGVSAPGAVSNIEASLGLLGVGLALLPQLRAPAPVPPTAGETGLVVNPGISAPAPVSPAADPYSGLTPAQIEFLGNADPTDPFIMPGEDYHH